MNNSEINIRKLQLVELETLKEFINACDKLNLKYYLIGGTLLGCIRHEGFIPWDDDIDIAMPRGDYEKFVKNAQDLLKEKYFIQNYKTDKEFVLNFTKIRNSETTFIETTSKNRNINHGIYIDVFPIDGISESKIENLKAKILNILYNFQTDKYFYILNQIKKSWKGNLLFSISNLLYGKKSLREIQDKKEKLYTKYKFDNSLRYNSYCGIYGDKEIGYISDLGNGIEKKFEGLKVLVPTNYDIWLHRIYGDYMKLPPKEKQIAHHYNEIIDIKNTYKKYI